MAAGDARPGAIVRAGNARFEVLEAGLVRMEYSADRNFVNTPSYNALNRNFTVPQYKVNSHGGWITITTAAMRLSYKLGSGPFTTLNTRVRLLKDPEAGSVIVAPAWESECTFGQVCQSGAAKLMGGALLSGDHTGYDSPAGFIANIKTAGDGISWAVLGAPSGSAIIKIRYANNRGTLNTIAPRQIDLLINGVSRAITLPATSSWNTWSIYKSLITLRSGTNTIALQCTRRDVSAFGCNVNLDDISITALDKKAVSVLPSGGLGGYIRSFDSTNGSYSRNPICVNGKKDANCQASIPVMVQGLLDKSGWYLLDDSKTDLWTREGWVTPRRANGDIEDGYLFVYGTDYTSALRDLEGLTGPSPLLPEYMFGNWFSRYYPYTSAEYQTQLLPEYRANNVTLDTLSIDTDWKSPSQWDGWEWNRLLFPQPASFLKWIRSQGVHVTMNIHSSISTADPRYQEAQDIAGNELACSDGKCTWDWSKIAQAESNFALQSTFMKQGVSFWWLDWCCDNSEVSMRGITPDSWINHLYAQQMIDSDTRGFVLSRIGSSHQSGVAGAYPSGAWGDHRSAIAFTGDTWSTWNTLQMEAQLSQDEASIGMAYISDDIGGFLGSYDRHANIPDDLYLRWLGFGVFQPIMREHSNSGQNARLPWEYDSSARIAGDKFLQLRSRLVPYLYTTAADAARSGLPMTRPLYLSYPNAAESYEHPTEYMLGSQILVAPVTVPGTLPQVKVWFPNGKWTDWFTGATFMGPATYTMEMPLDREPVFVKDGGIVTLQPSTSHAQAAGRAPITLRVFAGDSGHASMYDDSGSGLGYERGQYTNTPITYSMRPDSSTLTVGAAVGSYPGEPETRVFTVDLINITRPHDVELNGQPLISSQWNYDLKTHTVTVNIGKVSVSYGATVTVAGAHSVYPAQANTY